MMDRYTATCRWMTMAVISWMAVSTAHAAVPGDLTNDGKLNISDVTFALRISTGLVTATPEQLAIGDVIPNPGADGRAIGDGKVTVADVVRLLQAVVGLVSPDDLLPAGPTLKLDTQALQTAFNAGTGGDVIVPLVFQNAKDITVGRVRLTLTPQGTSAPPVTITQVARGDLTQGAFLFSTNPETLPSEGVNTVLVAFVQSKEFSGSGNIMTFTVHIPDGIPSGSSYTLSLGDLSFSNKNSEAVEPKTIDGSVSRP